MKEETKEAKEGWKYEVKGLQTPQDLTEGPHRLLSSHTPHEFDFYMHHWPCQNIFLSIL